MIRDSYNGSNLPIQFESENCYSSVPVFKYREVDLECVSFGLNLHVLPSR